MFLACAMLYVIVGCSGRPARIDAPSLDPQAAGSAAMAQYDVNGDGFVDGQELAKAPSLAAARGVLDANGDGRISAEEIAQRVQFWADRKLGRIATQCRVTRNGVPLPGAIVTYEPEKFLGDAITGGSGQTNTQGMAVVSVAGANPPGVPCGLYLVRVTMPDDAKAKIPEKYNTRTVIGCEVAPYAPQPPMDLKF